MTLRKKLYPWAIALPKKISVSLATLFGLGNLKAPGTWGSAAGVILYGLLFYNMSILPYVVFCALLAYIAAGICDSAERFIGVHDPHRINLDEFVAMPICYMPLLGEPFSLPGVVLGFVFFRFFDIKKPWIINKFQSIEGGGGIVADDVAAAIITCLVINAFGYFMSGYFA